MIALVKHTKVSGGSSMGGHAIVARTTSIARMGLHAVSTCACASSGVTCVHAGGLRGGSRWRAIASHGSHFWEEHSSAFTRETKLMSIFICTKNCFGMHALTFVFASLQAFSPRVMKICIDFVRAVPEPRSTGTTATDFFAGVVGAAFGPRGGRGHCIIVWETQ